MITISRSWAVTASAGFRALAACALFALSSGVASAQIGVNLDGNTDWSTARIWVDVRHTFRKWGNAEKPWEAKKDLKLTEDGYPLEDAGTCALLTDYPDGIYKFSYEGKATVTFASNMAKLEGPLEHKGNVTRGNVRVKHDGGLLHLKVTQIDKANPIRNMKLLAPGASPQGKEIYSKAFRDKLEPFACLRFMDWLLTNNSELTHWKDRTRPESFGCAVGSHGVSYEDCLALSEQLGKEAWITIPQGADDDFVKNLAKLTKSVKIPIHVELSNELWNSQFKQFHALVKDAKANPDLTHKDDFGRAAEQAALRTVQISKIFKAEGSPALIVLSGQAVNPYFLECGLKYVDSKFGPPQKFIDEIAIAPYIALPAAKEAGLTLDSLFVAMDEYLDKLILPTTAAHGELAKKYHVALVAYEGGQHLVGEQNEQLKKAAQFDARMGELLTRQLTSWKKGGGGVFCHFAHIAPYSKFGYWGLLETIDSPPSVKWKAITAFAQKNSK